MPLTANLGTERLVSVDMSDEAWSSVYKPKSRVGLTCPFCGGAMYAKVRQVRFFAHFPGAAPCASAGESAEHLRLKLLVLGLARQAGWDAQPEARRAPGADVGGEASWVADVLCLEPGGTGRVAFEIQLSSQSPSEARERTDRYRADGIEVVWIVQRLRPWTEQLPCVVVADDLVTDRVFGPSPDSSPHGENWWWEPTREPIELAQFVADILGRHLVATEIDYWGVGWVSVHHLAQAEAVAARAARAEAERERRREAAKTDHQRNQEAWLERRRATRSIVTAALTDAGFSYRIDETSPLASGTAIEVPEHGDAVQCYLVCPVASRIDRVLLTQLSSTDIVIVASPSDVNRLRAAAPGARVVEVTGPGDVPLPDRDAVARSEMEHREKVTELRLTRAREALVGLAAWLGQPVQTLADIATIEGDQLFVDFGCERYYCSPTVSPPRLSDRYAALTREDQQRIKSLGWERGIYVGDTAPVQDVGPRPGTAPARAPSLLIERQPSDRAPTPADVSMVASRLLSWLHRQTRSAAIDRHRMGVGELVTFEGQPLIAVIPAGTPPMHSARVSIVVGGPTPLVTSRRAGWIDLDTHHLRFGQASIWAPLAEWRYDPEEVLVHPSP